MEPKAIRPVSSKIEPEWQDNKVGDITQDGPIIWVNAGKIDAAPVKKTEITYEQRLKKMTNRQLHHEIKRGIRGDLTGYRSVAESVVLDVILKSFEQGMSPVVR
jgi:hypothetical protein